MLRPNRIKYPVLEAALVNTEQDISEMAEYLEISVKAFVLKCSGGTEWLLSECILLRDLLTPDLSIDELFTMMPDYEYRPVTLTEENMRGGFKSKKNRPPLEKDMGGYEPGL